MSQEGEVNLSSATPQALPPRRRGIPTWLPWLTAAALGIIAIIMGVQNRVLNEQVSDEAGLVTNLAAKASHAQQVWEILTSPQAQRVTLAPGKTPNEPMGRVIYLSERGGLIFQANDLKPLPQGMTYELWMVPANDHAAISAGLFKPDSAGAASVVMPPILPGVAAKSFGVTMENAGGSPTPTMPFLLSGTVTGK
jgi:anti-sigma-K factor RskA